MIENMNNLVELHLHLDGALSIDNCKKIAKIQNIELPDDETIKEMLTVNKDCHDLNEFLTKFAFPLSLLQTKEGVKNAVKNLGDELKEQGLIYAEIRFAPQLHLEKNLTMEEVVEAAIDGSSETSLNCNLILCCMRGNNKEANLKTVEVAKKYLGKKVVAIDLAGAEALYPTKDFKYIFDYAKKLEVPFIIHAGEADGASSVKDAINFGALRIGHGVRAVEDIEVLNLLKEKNITLEICPTSNICTAIYNNINEIPFKEFIDRGINVTINTDDPSICNTTLKQELKKIADSFNLEYNDILKLQINAINASFASNKEELLKEVGL